MVTEVILPVLGETVNASTIVEWFRKEGDRVGRGDPLFSAESDKAVLEVEASTAGFLRKILVPAGEKVPVLTVIALMTPTATESLEDYQIAGLMPPAREAPSPTAEPKARPLAGPGPAPGRPFASPRARKAAREKGVELAGIAGSGPGGRIIEQDVLGFLAAQPKATPVAARMAEALGVDLAAVRGTGIGGQITKSDVEAAAVRPAPPVVPAVVPPPGPVAQAVPKRTEAAAESVPVTGLRRIIAERMTASHQATARVTLTTEADATALVEVREQLKAALSEEWGFAPGYNDLLGLIVARALREFPYMNARLSPDGQTIERYSFVNLGMAVDTERGLLVLVLRNADEMGLRAFGSEFRVLVERARAGKALPDDLTGSTFTITNLGMYDVDVFTPIINLPEAAILGAGRIQPKPVVYRGEITIRQMWVLSLTFDHRLVDGAPAARFLQRIKQLTENPYLLLA